MSFLALLFGLVGLLMRERSISRRALFYRPGWLDLKTALAAGFRSSAIRAWRSFCLQLPRKNWKIASPSLAPMMPALTWPDLFNNRRRAAGQQFAPD
jgi:hypothetical protein